MTRPPCFGIDLGTSRSAIAVVEDGAPRRFVDVRVLCADLIESRFELGIIGRIAARLQKLH